MFTNADWAVLKDFREGKDVFDKEKLLLNKAALLGIIRFGMTFRHGKVIQQARLTQRGKDLLQDFEILQKC